MFDVYKTNILAYTIVFQSIVLGSLIDWKSNVIYLDYLKMCDVLNTCYMNK